MEIFSTKKRRVDHTHMHSEQGECTENLGKGYKSSRLAKKSVYLLPIFQNCVY
jgi:hypothetical protein